MPEDIERTTLYTQSGVNARGQAFVQITRDGKVIAQLTPEETREHALGLLNAAEAALSDAYLVSWVKEHVGAGEVEAAGLLADFRRWREKRGGRPFEEDKWVINPTAVKPIDGQARAKKID